MYVCMYIYIYICVYIYISYCCTSLMNRANYYMILLLHFALILNMILDY